MRQKKECFNGKFHLIRGIYKIILKLKIRLRNLKSQYMCLRAIIVKQKSGLIFRFGDGSVKICKRATASPLPDEELRPGVKVDAVVTHH